VNAEVDGILRSEHPSMTKEHPCGSGVRISAFALCFHVDNITSNYDSLLVYLSPQKDKAAEMLGLPLVASTPSCATRGTRRV
jgi:hypothetical protein